MTRRRGAWSPSASFDRSLADDDEQLKRRADAQRERVLQECGSELEQLGTGDQ
ncbi:MAG: hypothetical protein NTV84_06605 [Methanoregula sp.]|nr:hypothetical protein [Methanoregula sp.]